MRQLIIVILSNLTLGCQSQELEYRSVEYYFDQVAKLELNELIKQEINLIRLITKTPENIKKANEIRIKGIENIKPVANNGYK